MDDDDFGDDYDWGDDIQVVEPIGAGLEPKKQLENLNRNDNLSPLHSNNKDTYSLETSAPIDLNPQLGPQKPTTLFTNQDIS